MAQKSLYSPEAVLSDAALHLAEVGLGWNFILISADAAEVGVSPQPFHQILYVGDLLQLTEHKSPQVRLWAVLHRPSRPLQRIGWIGVKSNISNNSLGEPVSFIAYLHRGGWLPK